MLRTIDVHHNEALNEIVAWLESDKDNAKLIEAWNPGIWWRLLTALRKSKRSDLLTAGHRAEEVLRALTPERVAALDKLAQGWEHEPPMYPATPGVRDVGHELNDARKRAQMQCAADLRQWLKQQQKGAMGR